MAEQERTNGVFVQVPKLPRHISDIMGKVKQKMLMQYYENVVSELDNEEKIDRDICNSIYLAVAIGSWEIDK